jgi:hypothetical protein
VAGENVLDSIASPQIAMRGLWATPSVREAKVPSNSRVLCMAHSSIVGLLDVEWTSGWSTHTGGNSKMPLPTRHA